MYNNNELVGTLQHPDKLVKAVMHFLKTTGTKKSGSNLDFSKTFADMVRYDTINIATGGAGVKEYFQGDFSQDRTNMEDSFRSAQSEHMVITGMRLETGVGTVLNDVDLAQGLPTGANGAAMKSAVVSITNNIETGLSRYPISEALADLTVRDNGFIKFKAPIAWIGNTNIKVNVNFPVAPEPNQILRIKLIGLGFTS